MKITESQLRQTIRKTIKEFYASYGSRLSPTANSYTEFTHQDPSMPVDKALRSKLASEESEEGICPACHGKGIVMGRDCRMCDGTGEIEN